MAKTFHERWVEANAGDGAVSMAEPASDGVPTAFHDRWTQFQKRADTDPLRDRAEIGDVAETVGQTGLSVPEADGLVRSAYRGLDPKKEAADQRAILNSETKIGFWESFLDNPEKFIPVWGTLKGIGELGAILSAAQRLEANAYGTPVEGKPWAPPFGGAYAVGGVLPTGAAMPTKEQDQQTVNTWLEQQAEIKERGYGFGGRVGQIMGEMPAFVGDILLTRGLYTGTKAATVALLKKAAKEAVEEQAKKAILRRGAEGLTAWAIASGVRAGVGTPHRVAETYLQHRLPENVMVDADGRMTFQWPTEAPATTLLKAWGDIVIELASEEAGGTLAKGGKLAGHAMLQTRLGKQILPRLYEGYRKAHAAVQWSDFVRHAATKAGYHGILAELGEEYLGDQLRAVAALDDFGTGAKAGMLERMGAAFVYDVKNTPEMAVSFAPLAVGGAAVSRVMAPKPAAEVALAVGPQGELIETPLPAEQEPVPAREPAPIEATVAPEAAGAPGGTLEAEGEPATVLPPVVSPTTPASAQLPESGEPVAGPGKSGTIGAVPADKGAGGSKAPSRPQPPEGTLKARFEKVKAALAKVDKLYAGEGFWQGFGEPTEADVAKLEQTLVGYRKEPAAIPAATPKQANPITDLLEKYEGTGEIETAGDLANETEALAEELDNQTLRDAVKQYHEILRENREEYGERGGLEEDAENQLLAALRSEAPSFNPTPRPQRAGTPAPAPAAGKETEEEKSLRRRMAREGGFLRIPWTEPAKPAPLPPFLQKVKDSLTAARKTARAVKREKKAALRERVSAAREKLDQLIAEGMDPEKALDISRGPLEGQLTEYQERFPSIRGPENDPAIAAVFKKIATDPSLLYFEKQDLKQAFTKLVDGDYLTLREAALLEQYFPELAEAVAGRVPWQDRMWNMIPQILHLWRGVLTGPDVSGIMRQGRLLMQRFPALAPEFVANYGKAFLTDAQAKQIDLQTRSGEWYEESVLDGVNYAEAGPHAEVSKREERMMSASLLGKLPVIGGLYRASERSYAIGLNWFRYNAYVQMRKLYGDDISEADRKSIAQSINDLSGRSSLGRDRALQRLGPWLNALFAPRLFVSRIKVPLKALFSLPASAAQRRVTPTMNLVAASLASLVATNIAIALLVKWAWPDTKTEVDPRSSDFGKIKIGKQRFDLYTGLLQQARLMAQLVTGQRKTGAEEIVDVDRWDLVTNFLRTKESPLFGLLTDAWTGQNYMGDAFGAPPTGGPGPWMTDQGIPDWAQGISKEVWNRAVNIAVADVADAYINEGIPQAIAAFGASEVGIGVQTYNDSPSVMLAKVRNGHALDEYGKRWDDLTPDQQKALHRRHPDIEQAELQKKREVEPLRTLSLDEQVQAGRNIEKALSQEVRAALRESAIRTSVARKLGDFYLNDERYAAYQNYAAAEIQKQVDRRLADPEWADKPVERKVRILQIAVDKAKEQARTQLMRDIRGGHK